MKTVKLTAMKQKKMIEIVATNGFTKTLIYATSEAMQKALAFFVEGAETIGVKVVVSYQ